MRFPCASKQSPFDRPHGPLNVESLPSTDHFRIRSFGWSVKKTLPSASDAGPSVNLNSPASICSFAPGATTPAPPAAGGSAAATASIATAASDTTPSVRHIDPFIDGSPSSQTNPRPEAAVGGPCYEAGRERGRGVCCEG